MVGEAAGRYKTQDELLPLLQYVIAELTPDFCRLRADLVSVHARALADSILISNISDADQRAELMRQLRLSREWTELDTAAAKINATPLLPVNAEITASPSVVQEEPIAIPSTPATEVAAESEPPIFVVHSEDYRSISLKGQKYDLGWKPAAILKLLHKAYLAR